LPTHNAIKAGEVWDARLDPTVRPEQGGTRPVIVISTDWFNESENYLFFVVPITGTDRGIDYDIKLKGREGGLSKNSLVMCDQVRSISALRFIRKRGEISSEKLASIRKMAGRMIDAHRLFGGNPPYTGH